MPNPTILGRFLYIGRQVNNLLVHIYINFEDKLADTVLYVKRTPILLLSGIILAGLSTAGYLTAERFEHHRVEEKKQTVQQLATSSLNEIEDALFNALETTLTASMWIQRDGDVNKFQTIASELVQRYPGLNGLAMAPEGIVKQSYPHSHLIVGHKLFEDSELGPLAKEAKLLRRLTIAEHKNEDGHTQSIVGCLPVFTRSPDASEAFWGIIVATVDVKTLIKDSSVSLLHDAGYDFSLTRVTTDGKKSTVYKTATSSAHDSPVEAGFDIATSRWVLAVIPHGGWSSPERTRAELGVTFALALLFTILLHHSLLRSRQRQLAEEAMNETQERYALAVRGVNDGIWDWNLTTEQFYCSARWRSMLGYESEDIVCSPETWFREIHPTDVTSVREGIKLHIEGENPHFEAEYRMRDASGEYRWMLCRGLAVWDVDGVATRIAGSQTDISDRKQFEAKLTHDALYDALTALPNRALFMDRLEHLVRRNTRKAQPPFAVLFLDMDHFKVVNDSLGHMVGDHLLVEVASRVKQCVRPGDTVARLGGDEFAVLLPEISDIRAASVVACRIQDELGQSFDVKGHEIYATASIGIATSFSGSRQAMELLRDADTAMYRAKEKGRAGHAIFDYAMHEDAVKRLQIENDLRRAVQNAQELELYYQPLVNCDDRSLEGFEALIRWNHPEKGMISPFSFIPIAEETGLIVPVGQWVLEEACRQVAEWRKQFPNLEHLAVSVNLSTRQFKQTDLAKTIQGTLDHYGVKPSAIKLEITESALMEHVDKAASMLKELKELGLEIHIDDFGTGYSSLAYLNQFPLDALKIDRSFVNRIDDAEEKGCIATAIASLAHDLGLKVVAEGVETERQFTKIKSLTVDYAQGYLFDKPLPAPKAAVLIEQASGQRSKVTHLDTARHKSGVRSKPKT